MRLVQPGMNRILVTVAALAMTAAQAAPFKDLCEKFEPLRKISDLQYVRPTVKVEPKAEGVKPQDVVFTIAAKSGPIRLSAGPDALIQFPFSDKLCDENPDISVNQPKGTVALGISIDPALPPAQSVDYKRLELLRTEWDTAISRQSLVWRMLAPSPKAYQILFEPGKTASAEIKLASGIRKMSADQKGELRIPFEDAWKNANPTIAFSEVPKKIGLLFNDGH